MLRAPAVPARALHTVSHQADLVVVGGGLAGLCAALTAARAGLRVVLAHDRPVLGGNSSSEVRLWVLGATAHMHNNNRWAREGGLVNEILLENQWRNPEGNPYLFDTVLLEKAAEEPNLTLLLNTAVDQVRKDGPDRIAGVSAFCSQNSTRYELTAPLFCDASGDGIVGFLAGAAFRLGAEARDEFDEGFAPSEAYGELLGHSLYFYSKDVGRPVPFVAPSFALRDITAVPRWRQFNTATHGCRLWWIEYGGRLDTVHDTEAIKWELWRVVYGVWDHIKNSGQFPEAETMTLEWVGAIPGKRESRRFEGDWILTQRDLIELREHPDVVSYGGWSIDLHPADGVYSARPGCDQWHARGIFGIPYRCLYSRNVANLFLAGRLISASHVAFGSTRVMGTCANSAQAVGMAAALCRRHGLQPRDLAAGEPLAELQRELQRAGQHLPGRRLDDPDDLARAARVEASSQLQLATLPADGETVALSRSWGQLLPVPAGRVPRVTCWVDVAAPTRLTLQLRAADRPDRYTWSEVLAERTLELPAGEQQAVELDVDVTVAEPRYLLFGLLANEQVAVHTSPQRVTGLVSVHHARTQQPAEDIGVETFEMWVPGRRPGGRNLALRCDPPLPLGAAAEGVNGLARPTDRPNAWVADPADSAPRLALAWDRPQRIARVELTFDADWDHAMESVLMGHPERAMPFCVKHYRLLDGAGNVWHEERDNHQARRTVRLPEPRETDRLELECLESWGEAPAALFEIRCYAEERPRR